MVKSQKGGRLGINMSATRGDYSGYSTNKMTGLCNNAYGETRANSHGTFTEGEGFMGANMHVHPNSSGLQTGGKRKKSKAKKEKAKTMKRNKGIKKGKSKRNNKRN
tara:strand:- start:49 stop:366 length:318 start_codon:yes stop_codon:yes gene_type:complete